MAGQSRSTSMNNNHISGVSFKHWFPCTYPPTKMEVDRRSLEDAFSLHMSFSISKWQLHQLTHDSSIEIPEVLATSISGNGCWKKHKLRVAKFFQCYSNSKWHVAKKISWVQQRSCWGAMQGLLYISCRNVIQNDTTHCFIYIYIYMYLQTCKDI